MEVRAMVIRPNNKIQAITLRSVLDYREMLDGAWPDSVSLMCGVVYIDKKTIFIDTSDINTIATRLMQMVSPVQPPTWIYGPAIVVGLPDTEGHDTNIPQKLSTLIHLIEAGVRAKSDR